MVLRTIASLLSWINMHFSSTASICIATPTAVIALLQWRTNKRRLMLDLHNKGREMHDCCLELYHHLLVWKGSEPDQSAHSRFVKQCREARLLFGTKDKIHEVLGEMDAMAFQVKGFKEYGGALAQASPADFVKKHAETDEALLIRFPKAISTLEQILSTRAGSRRILV